VTNGGNLSNQRYSTLKEINTSNVKQLKGAWMTRLKGSGFDGKYSFEASPLVKDGIMYVITGADDVFALDAKTGEILWEYWSGASRNRASAVAGPTAVWRWVRGCCFSGKSTPPSWPWI
jgi:quinohemoprotein ethanol dehydrogenase